MTDSVSLYVELFNLIFCSFLTSIRVSASNQEARVILQTTEARKIFSIAFQGSRSVDSEKRRWSIPRTGRPVKHHSFRKPTWNEHPRFSKKLQVQSLRQDRMVLLPLSTLPPSDTNTVSTPARPVQFRGVRKGDVHTPESSRTAGSVHRGTVDARGEGHGSRRGGGAAFRASDGHLEGQNCRVPVWELFEGSDLAPWCRFLLRLRIGSRSFI